MSNRQKNIKEELQRTYTRIRELDMENLIIQAERGVTLGALDELVKPRGLMFAPYTPDKKDLTLGEMYGKQVGSLTGQKYGLPKFHVMGLEVLLASGEILKTGGKTVKNVTGYDMTRLFLSARDSIGLPIAYTLKLLPQEEISQYYLVYASGFDKMQLIADGINEKKIVPGAACFWDVPEMKPVQLLLGLTGIKEKVGQDLKALNEIVRETKSEISFLEECDLEKIWETVSQLRKNTAWHDCFKILPDRLGQFLEIAHKIADGPIGLWGNPMQGKINVLLSENISRENIYQKMANYVKETGGDASWYYNRQFNMENPLLKQIADNMKNTFDPDNIFRAV